MLHQELFAGELPYQVTRLMMRSMGHADNGDGCDRDWSMCRLGQRVESDSSYGSLHGFDVASDLATGFGCDLTTGVGSVSDCAIVTSQCAALNNESAGSCFRVLLRALYRNWCDRHNAYAAYVLAWPYALGAIE